MCILLKLPILSKLYVLINCNVINEMQSEFSIILFENSVEKKKKPRFDIWVHHRIKKFNFQNM